MKTPPKPGSTGAGPLRKTAPRAVSAGARPAVKPVPPTPPVPLPAARSKDRKTPTRTKPQAGAAAPVPAADAKKTKAPGKQRTVSTPPKLKPSVRPAAARTAAKSKPVTVASKLPEPNPSKSAAKISEAVSKIPAPLPSGPKKSPARTRRGTVKPAASNPSRVTRKAGRPLAAVPPAAPAPVLASPLAAIFVPAPEPPVASPPFPPTPPLMTVPRAGLPAIPPILLEGDPSKKPTVTAPAKTPVAPANARLTKAPSAVHPTRPAGVKRSGAPVAPVTKAPTPKSPVSFPSAGSLWLVARDPFCLCAHWDFEPTALAGYARENAGGWRLRVWVEMLGAWLANDQPLPSDTAHRFVPVLLPATRYVAEIGFQQPDGSWRGLAVSRPVMTPADGVSADTDFTLATLPPEPVTPESLLQLPPDAPAPRWVGPVHRPQFLWPDLAAAAQLSALVGRTLSWSGVGNSAAISELVGAPIPPPPDIARAGVAPLPSSESAPVRPASAPPGFWFKVNAEVILYGSTERNARVTIGGRPVQLRDDGSFSFRFALPDGEFQLPVVAVSAAGDDPRAAEVTFARTTVLHGEVGTHPPDAALGSPTAESVS